MHHKNFCVTKVESLNKAIAQGVLPRYYDGLYQDIQIALGAILRQKRKESSYTQKAIARKVFCSSSTISAIENGAVFCNMQTFYKLCQLYNHVFGVLLNKTYIDCLYNYYQQEWFKRQMK